MYWLNENIVWVKGYCKSAIYDFSSSNVYWADEELTCKIENFLLSKIECDSIKKLIESNFINKDFIKEYKLIDFYECPKMAWLELTQKCNLRCLHCYTGDEHVSSNNSMNLDDWKKVIDELKENDFSSVILIGGEPLLYPHIKELIEYIFDKNIQIILFSNLTLLNDDILDVIVRKKVMVHFSLYSSLKEEHDKITSIKGSYDRLISSLSKLLQRGVKVKPAVTIMKENSGATKGIIELLKSYDIELKKIDCIRPMEGGNQSIHMPNENILKGFQMHHPNFKANRSFFEKATKVNTCLCGKFSISETGEIYPCEFIRNISYGNVKNKSINDIIKELKETVWAITADDIEGCKDCEFRYACKDCRHLSINKPYQKKYRCFYNPKTGKFE